MKPGHAVPNSGKCTLLDPRCTLGPEHQVAATSRGQGFHSGASWPTSTGLAAGALPLSSRRPCCAFHFQAGSDPWRRRKGQPRPPLHKELLPTELFSVGNAGWGRGWAWRWGTGVDIVQGIWEGEGIPRAALTWASVREMESRIFHPNQIRDGGGGGVGWESRPTEKEGGLRCSQTTHQEVQEEDLPSFFHPIWGHHYSPLVPQAPKISVG